MVPVFLFVLVAAYLFTHDVKSTEQEGVQRNKSLSLQIQRTCVKEKSHLSCVERPQMETHLLMTLFCCIRVIL